MANRRNFLKSSGLLGLGTLLGARSHSHEMPGINSDTTRPLPSFGKVGHKQIFNMCGFAAPAMRTVRVGIIGIGNRGLAAVRRLSYIEGVDIKALCDLVPSKTRAGQKIAEAHGHKPDLYFAGEKDWENICNRDDIDLIYNCTTWEWHVPIAVYAMEHGQHVGLEVPAATSIEDCWKLVETSERTRRHCVILENCCYDFFELLTLSMVRQGVFGEVVHGEGAYIHNHMKGKFPTNEEFWKSERNYRNANIYPTHGLGPICQIMDINRGDKLEYLTTMATQDFAFGPAIERLSEDKPTLQKFVGKEFRGNMNNTLIKTHKGKTILIQYDTTTPRPYSRIHLVSGTEAIAQKWPSPERIALGFGDWLTSEEMKELYQKYEPAIIKKIGAVARQIGGHGGMDFMMDWRLIDCLRNGLPMDMDVYDAAVWSSIVPLSEWSIANRSNSIDVPDFTGGSWQTNKPVDISIKEGTTKIKEIKR